MALPKYNELYVPFLTVLIDGNVHALKEIKQSIADTLCLSAEELSERLPSGKQFIFDNLMGWARTYLKKRGSSKRPKEDIFPLQIREDSCCKAAFKSQMLCWQSVFRPSRSS